MLISQGTKVDPAEGIVATNSNAVELRLSSSGISIGRPEYIKRVNIVPPTWQVARLKLILKFKNELYC